MADPQRSLANIELLAELDPRAREAFEQRCRWFKYAAQDQIIDRESDTRDVYFVIEGRVRVVNYSLSGREISFDDLTDGTHFGELAALDGQPRSANVVAITDTRVASVSPQTFTNLLADNPEIALKVATKLAAIIRASTDRIMDLSTLGAHNRVHSDILRQAYEVAGDDNTAMIKPIPVHADIAARVSTTRETVARVLSDLAKQGLVKRGKMRSWCSTSSGWRQSSRTRARSSEWRRRIAPAGCIRACDGGHFAVCRDVSRWRRSIGSATA